MIDPRRRHFGPYLRDLADRMGLRDWTVGITDNSPDDSNHVAEIDCRYGRKLAWVALSDAFLDSTPEQQRETMIHELVHCHFHPMITLVQKMILTTEGVDGIRLALEYGVDAVAVALAPHLPLPPDADDAAVGSDDRKGG